jgi:hypothetical protein
LKLTRSLKYVYVLRNLLQGFHPNNADIGYGGYVGVGLGSGVGI